MGWGQKTRGAELSLSPIIVVALGGPTGPPLGSVDASAYCGASFFDHIIMVFLAALRRVAFFFDDFFLPAFFLEPFFFVARFLAMGTSS